MPTDDVVDPSVQEADQRATRAKQSLLARMEMLKQRYTDAKHRFSPHEQIARYPIQAVGAAFALGVIAGLGRGRRDMPGEARSSLTRLALTGLAAVALRVVREAALTQLAQAAHNWLSAQEGPSGQAPGEPRAPGGRTTSVEPLHEH
jgi:hypothetical protein